MRPTVLLLFCALAALPLAAAPGGTPQSSPDSLSLDVLVSRVLQENAALQQGSAQVQALEARVGMSESAAYPHVDGEASYSRVGPVVALDFPGFGTFSLFPENNVDAHLAVRQTVYDFGKTAVAVDLSRSLAEAARQGHDAAASGLAFEAARSFYTLLMLRESQRVQREQIAALEEHLQVTLRRRDAGTATDFDVLTTRVRVASARSQETDIINAWQREAIGLARLLGGSGDPLPPLRGQFQPTAPLPDPDTLVAAALAHRPEYAAARTELGSADLRARVAVLAFRPSLGVSASYGIKNGFLPNLNALRGNWVAAVQLRIPVYEGGMTESMEEEAAAGQRAAQAHLDDVTRQIAADVRRAVADAAAARNKLQTAALQVEQAREAHMIAQRRYAAGVISNLDLLDAETALAQADLTRVQALYASTMAAYAVARATGQQWWNK